RFDRTAQVLGLLFAPQRQRLQLAQPLGVARETEQIARLPDQTRLEQLRHLLAPEALDVERLAADEVAQALGDLRRADQPAGAAPHRLARRAHGLAAARRAAVRENVGLGVLRPPLGADLDHLGNDVARALHHDGVADADVLAPDVILVVQGGAGHHHAADGHRLVVGDLRERPGPAHLDGYPPHPGLRLFGR